MSNSRWIVRETDANLTLMSNVLHINEITANVMANRGLRSKNAALSFLTPSEEKMHDIFKMKDVKKLVKRIAHAIPNEKIVIYGDYDVDGIMSTVILLKLLTNLGANCSYYIPHRMEEGYGLNKEAIKKLAEDGTDLLITVDNGIAAHYELELANEMGIETVIIDHHEPGFSGEGTNRKDILPKAVAIVDPKQSDCDYPFKEMCAAGLAFKVAAAICDYLNIPFKQHDEFVVFAAIATICDIVDLKDENRVIVVNGLKILNQNKDINCGLSTLLTLRGYDEKPLDTFSVGFVIGPCLNATGRLGTAELAVKLLMTDHNNDKEEALKLAEELINLNEARKQLTTECIDRAVKAIPEPLPKVIVILDKEAHESVAGIVAGKVREITHRPTIILTLGDGELKGSGRSVENYNLFEALYSNKGLFTRFGGHSMAAGLTLPEENVNKLREALNDECILTDDDFRPIIYVDKVLKIEDISLSLSGELEKLAPFGKGNNEPFFITYGLMVESVRVLDEKRTLIFSFANGHKKLKGIAFGLNEFYHEAIKKADIKTNSGFCMDIVYGIETNVWNGNVSVQVRVRDFRVS